MLNRITRLFVIKNKFEASAIIYAMALGSVERGQHYLTDYPGFQGKMLFCACFVAVFMAGAKIMDGVRATPPERKILKVKKNKASAIQPLNARSAQR